MGSPGELGDFGDRVDGHDFKWASSGDELEAELAIVRS